MKTSYDGELQFDIQIKRLNNLPNDSTPVTLQIYLDGVPIFFRGNISTTDALYTATQVIKNDGGRLLRLYYEIMNRAEWIAQQVVSGREPTLQDG